MLLGGVMAVAGKREGGKGGQVTKWTKLPVCNDY